MIQKIATTQKKKRKKAYGKDKVKANLKKNTR